MNNLITKAYKDLSIYQNYTFRVFRYYVDGLGWIDDVVGLLVKPLEVHHYHSYSDELEVYYSGRLLSMRYECTEVLFLGGNYYAPNDNHDWLFTHEDWDFY